MLRALVWGSIMISASAFAAGKKPRNEPSCALPPTAIRVLPVFGEREFQLPDGQAHDLDIEFTQQLLGQLTRASGARVIQVVTESARSRLFMAEETPPDFWWEASVIPAGDLQVEFSRVTYEKGADVHWNIPLLGHLDYETASLRFEGTYQLGSRIRKFSIKKSSFYFDAGAYIPTQAGAIELAITLKRKGLVLRILGDLLATVSRNVAADAAKIPSLLRVDHVVNGEFLLGGTTGLSPEQRCGWAGKTLTPLEDIPGTLRISRSTIGGEIGVLNNSDTEDLTRYEGTFWQWRP